MCILVCTVLVAKLCVIFTHVNTGGQELWEKRLSWNLGSLMSTRQLVRCLHPLAT